MVLRKNLRHRVLQQDASNLCWRCLIRGTAFNPTTKRTVFATRPSRSVAVSPSQRRNGFNSEYFSANGLLRELVSTTTGRRELSNNVAHSIQTLESGERASSIARNNVTQDSISGTDDVLGPSSEELPHRRRKRLRALQTEEPKVADTPLPLDASSRLTTLGVAASTSSIRRRMLAYLALSKPRLAFLVMLTTTASYSLYPVPAILSTTTTEAPSLSPLTLLFLTVGTTLSIASANSLNMMLEPEHDAKMSRTRNRPIVRGLVSKRGAFTFAAVTAGLGLSALYYGTNPTVAGLSAANIILYAGIYTPLKRISTVNTWVGALVGGIPPLMGWAAAAGQCASQGGTWQELLFGPGSAGGWLLAGLLYAWQFPHFNAFSWTIRNEYKEAGYKMLASFNPARNARVGLRYSLLMFPICIGLSAVGVTDWGFAVTSSAINAWMTLEAVRFWRQEGKNGTARKLFWASVWQLPIVLVLAMAQKKGLWQRVWRGIVGLPNEEEEWEDEEEEQLTEGLIKETIR